jgi:tetratricopeptide (TPR) repeat protein
MNRLLPPLLLLLLIALPGAASAKDTRRAGEIQLQAREALDEGDAEEALRLARRAISLEAGPTTWLAQQIQIEVLEARGNLEQAMGCLQDYLALDGLFPEHLAWGQEARRRIGEALSRQRAQRTGRRGAGVALIVGGAAPLGIGVGFLANYGQKTAAGGAPELYGGFLDAGLALAITGGVVEGIGIALAASSAPPTGQASALRPVPTFAVSADGRVIVGLGGRF